MFLPEADKEYLIEKDISFLEIQDKGQNGLVINNWKLPQGKFNYEISTLLIFLPSGYPDCSPDMFYLYPGVRLVPEGRLARATEVNINFNGQSWQRWSRHLGSEHWRPGIDGIHTYLKRVENALQEARV